MDTHDIASAVGPIDNTAFRKYAPMKAATDEAYRRFPDPHDANLGSTRYGFIEGALWAGKEIERLTAENERLRTALTGLADVLPKIDAGTRGIFSIAAAHGAYYRGPTWKTELEAAQAVLAIDQQNAVSPKADD